jgi:hypothetical protein
MANVSILSDNPKLDKYADVTMAVGRGAPNRRDDVLLVQFMLNELFRRADEHVPPLAKPERPVGVDGKFGRNTFDGIVKFQLNIMSQFGSINLDGRIDPARASATSSISQTTYTILWMNYLYKLAWPQEFEDLLAGKIHNMPPELASPLNRYSQLWVDHNPYANVVGVMP